MSTLYIVGVPAGDPDDLTLRARRTLEAAARIIAGDADAAPELLAHHGIGTPLADIDDISDLMEVLASGDVAMLCDGRAFGLAGDAARLVGDVAHRGVPVTPVPGAVLPVTALVLSGLPAASFVYLGALPESPEDEGLLSAMAREPRTLLVKAAREALSGILDRLHELLGDRPMAVVAAHQTADLRVWRGFLGEAVAEVEYLPTGSVCILVIGGAREQAERWDEDRLRAQVQVYLRQGWGVKEISQQLAAESGWTRRDVYALAVEARSGL
jgi:16S rRNA (cytidine1402-2'-O)-methyltransferase